MDPRNRIQRMGAISVLMTENIIPPGYPTDHGEPPVRTADEQRDYEARVAWLYKDKYGLAFHYLPSMMRFKEPRQWTSVEWNAQVDSVDVDAVAAQIEETGAGYAVIAIAQCGDNYCSPNPVYEDYWGFEKGEYGTYRDLPMDFAGALAKRGIKTMCYVTASPPATPGPASARNGWVGEGRNYNEHLSEITEEAFRKWTDSLQWWSDHYGEHVVGWWVDGLSKDFQVDFSTILTAALKQGNPNALVTSGSLPCSDLHHGHCRWDWAEQKRILSQTGRWGPFNMQWHVFQYLGRLWGGCGVEYPDREMIDYACEVLRREGVMTFDLGVFDDTSGPELRVRDDQMAQLRLIRDAVDQLSLADR